MFFDFLWDGKNDKIKRTTTFKDFSKGGINMINVKQFIRAIKITWVKRYLNDNKKIYNIMLSENKDIENCFIFGTDYIEKSIKSLNNPFWKNVFEHYLFFTKHVAPKSRLEINTVPLWLNSNIKAGGKSFFKQNYVKKGILHINDIINTDGEFMSYNEFKEIYNVKTHFLEYAGLLSATKVFCNSFNFPEEKIKNQTPIHPHIIKILSEKDKGCKHIYDRLMVSSESINFDKWKQELNIDTSPVNYHTIPFKCCKDKHLQWFQCRINYRILGTNYMLEKMKIKPSNKCSYCKNKPETIYHLLCECTKVIPFWNSFRNYFQQYLIQTNINNEDIIFGSFKLDNILNTVLILAKYYIFKHRLSETDPNFTAFKKIIKSHYDIEYTIALKYLNVDSFHSTWTPYNTIVTDIQSL